VRRGDRSLDKEVSREGLCLGNEGDLEEKGGEIAVRSCEKTRVSKGRRDISGHIRGKGFNVSSMHKERASPKELRISEGWERAPCGLK